MWGDMPQSKITTWVLYFIQAEIGGLCVGMDTLGIG